MVSPNERTLMPLEVFGFQIEFVPRSVGRFEVRAVFTTLLNTFERNAAILKGECVDEIFALEGFETDEQIMDFGDIIAIAD